MQALEWRLPVCQLTDIGSAGSLRGLGLRVYNPVLTATSLPPKQSTATEIQDNLSYSLKS